MTSPRALGALGATVLAAAIMPGAAVAAERAVGVGPAERAGPGWTWPLAPRPTVAAPFDGPPGPYAPGHRGVDLRATVGQQVLAAGPGVVAFAGTVAGRGVLSVDHAGVRTTYEPVAPLVTVGAAVAAGDPIGTVTAAPGHCLPGTCLHWGVRRGETYLDPLALVGAAHDVRLLPHWGATPWVRWGSTPAQQPPHGLLPPGAVASVAPDRGPLLARR